MPVVKECFDANNLLVTSLVFINELYNHDGIKSVSVDFSLINSLLNWTKTILQNSKTLNDFCTCLTGSCSIKLIQLIRQILKGRNRLSWKGVIWWLVTSEFFVNWQHIRFFTFKIKFVMAPKDFTAKITSRGLDLVICHLYVWKALLVYKKGFFLPDLCMICDLR